MPKIPLYNQGQGATTRMATGALSPRANVGAFTAPAQAQADLAKQAGKIAFDFGMREKERETRRIYSEEFLKLASEGTQFNINNKDTNTEDYKSNYKTFQESYENRINTLNITKSQKASILQKLAPTFASQNIEGQQKAYARGTAIASANDRNRIQTIIEKKAVLPELHPDQIALSNELNDIFKRQPIDGLDLGSFTPQFVENAIAKRTVVQKLNAASSLKQLNEAQAFAEGQTDLTPEQLRSFRNDFESQKARVRSENVATLTTSLSLEDVGTELRTPEEIEARYNDLISGKVFKNNPALQTIFDDLDSQGKKEFFAKAEKDKNSMQSELTFQQSQAKRVVDEANASLFTDTKTDIIKGGPNAPSIADINKLAFQGEGGEKLREQLIALATKRARGEIVTDSSPIIYRGISQGIMNGSITSVTQKFTLPSEAGLEGFANRASNSEGKSILDRQGITISDQNAEDFEQDLSAKNRSSVSSEDKARTEALRRFDAFLQGNKELVQGNPAFQKFDPTGETRFYDFSQQMRIRFIKGLDENISPDQLLNPRSPEYILKDDDFYAISPQQQLDNIKKAFQKTEEPTLADVSPPPRPQGMSPSEYLNSEEYQLWVTSGKKAIFDEMTQ